MNRYPDKIKDEQCLNLRQVSHKRNIQIKSLN